MNTKLFLIAFAFLYSFTILTAQNKINIGIENGPSVIFLFGNKMLDQERQYGLSYSGGFTFQYNFNSILSFRTGLDFESKGAAERGNGPKYSYKHHIFLNYLTLPAFLKASFGKKVIFLVNTGPYIGYLTQGIEASYYSNIGKSRSDVSEYYKKIDFGASVGLGVNVPIGEKLLLSFEFRNNFGLYNISATQVYNDGVIQTYSGSQLVGLAYKLGSTSE